MEDNIHWTSWLVLLLETPTPKLLAVHMQATTRRTWGGLSDDERLLVCLSAFFVQATSNLDAKQAMPTENCDDHNFCKTTSWNFVFSSSDAYGSDLLRRSLKLTLEHN
jgi:hypothetical protein